jgi:hypothetical protein
VWCPGQNKRIALLNLSYTAVQVAKDLITLTPRGRLRLDGDGLTTCHVCSFPHSSEILARRGRFGGISEMPERESYVCIVVLIYFIYKLY